MTKMEKVFSLIDERKKKIKRLKIDYEDHCMGGGSGTAYRNEIEWNEEIVSQLESIFEGCRPVHHSPI